LRLWFGDRILLVTSPIAERRGVLSGERRSQGRQVKVADGLIAATALSHKLTIVTRHVRDFDHLGLTRQGAAATWYPRLLWPPPLRYENKILVAAAITV
jgi:hypothetical protein